MRRVLLAFGVATAAALTFAVAVLAANPHFINNNPDPGDPQCYWTPGNNFIDCSFKIAGLGNVSEVTANVEVTRTCTNRGENDPPGQVRSQPQTLEVSNGQTTGDDTRFTFRRLNCPDRMATSLGDTVAFFIDGVNLGDVPSNTVP